MIKVYLDNNIYKLLAESRYHDLVKEMLKMKDVEILILYSQAHINDLHRDRTDKKMDDLRFMDKFVDDNFLSYDFDTDSISNKLIRPVEAYGYFHSQIDSFEKLMTQTFADISDEDDFFSAYIDLLKSMPIDLGLDRIPDNQDSKNIIERLGLERKVKSLYEWLPSFGRMMDRLYDDDSIIKDLRSNSKSLLQVEKFKVNINEIDFKKNLADTQIGMSFDKFLESTFSNMTDEENKFYRYNRFVLSYILLTFLGLDKEKNKKVKYANTHHDGEHFFYSTLSDWVVSNDAGFLNKSRFLHNFYGLEIETMNLDQFAAKIAMLKRNRFLTAEELIQAINNEIKQGLVVSSGPFKDFSQKITKIKPRISFLEFFNRISISEVYVEKNAEYVILYNDSPRIYFHHWYKDFKAVTNKLISIFGLDIYGNGFFTDEDWKAIENQEWNGREWRFNNQPIFLSQNHLSKGLNLVFAPIIK